MADLIIGGENSLLDTSAELRGIYSRFPAGSPRFGHRRLDEGGRDEVARLYIPFESKRTRDAYVARAKRISPAAGKLAEALAITSLGTSNQYGIGYIDFILTDISEDFAEKVQVHEVLSDQYVSYFFGQRAPVFNMSGALLNTKQDDWAVAFRILYNSLLRGSKAADFGQAVRLKYGPRLATGVFLNMSQNINSSDQSKNGFSCALLVKRLDVFPQEGWTPTSYSVKSVTSEESDSVQREVLGSSSNLQGGQGNKAVMSFKQVSS